MLMSCPGAVHVAAGSSRGDLLCDLVAAGHTTGAHHLAVEDHAGRAHDAVAHDVAQRLDLAQGDGDVFIFCRLVDKRNGGFAVGTTGAEYFDALWIIAPGAILTKI